MADINKIKKINGKDIVADWSNIENKPDDLAKTSDVEKQIEQVRSEIPSIEGLVSEEYVDDRFEELTGAAPEALDTLEELAKALGEDENFSATILEELGKKQNTLTFDETPIEGSSNPVISGGLFEALFSKLDCSEGYDDKIDTYTDASITLYRIQSKSDGSSITKTYYLISNSSVIDSNTIKCYQIKIQEDSILTRYNTYFGTTFSDGWSSWVCFLSQTDVIDKLTDTSSTSPLSAKQGKILNDTKVDKIEGKDLSTNDFTDELKSKLDGIAKNANNYTHPETHPADMITGLANVATSGSYEDLTDTPESIYLVDEEGTLYLPEGDYRPAIKGDKGDSVHIRYSEHSDGTDFTFTWSKRQCYLGVYIGQSAPTEKEAYEWVMFREDMKPEVVIPTTLAPNTSYNFGEVTELNLSFPTDAIDGDIIYITFTSGSTATNLIVDTTNTSDFELIPEVNSGYEICGKFNGVLWILSDFEYTYTTA